MTLKLTLLDFSGDILLKWTLDPLFVKLEDVNLYDPAIFVNLKKWISTMPLIRLCSCLASFLHMPCGNANLAILAV